MRDADAVLVDLAADGVAVRVLVVQPPKVRGVDEAVVRQLGREQAGVALVLVGERRRRRRGRGSSGGERTCGLVCFPGAVVGERAAGEVPRRPAMIPIAAVTTIDTSAGAR